MDVREKILEAAARVYCCAGFRGTTTRRVATEAGVNEVTLFRHFGSKDALLREAIGRDWAAADCPRPPETPDDALGELTAWASAFTERLRVAAPLIRTRMGEFEEHPELIPEGSSPPARSASALSSYIRQLRDRGVATAAFDPDAAAAMLVGTLFVDAIARDRMPEMFTSSPADSVREYVRLFLRGIGVQL